MTAAAPWWALALLGLSVILLIVSLSRSKRTAIASTFALENDSTFIEYKRYVESRLKGINNGDSEIWKKLNLLSSGQESNETRFANVSTAVKDLGDMVVKASATAAGVNEGQKMLTSEFMQFRKDTNRAFLSIADWATTNIGKTILSNLFGEFPVLEETAPPLDKNKRDSKIADARFFTNMVRNETARMQAGQKILMRMQEAQSVAEQNVRDVIETHPSSVSPLDFREYYIALYVARQVAGLLQNMLRETQAEEHHHWPKMHDIMIARQRPKTG